MGINYDSLLNRLITVSGILISAIVLFAWLFDLHEVTTLIRGGASMKFNTALCFLLSFFGLYLYQGKREFEINLYYTLPLLVFIISSFTLISYYNNNFSVFDNLFVTDIYSKSLPGKMSPATGFSFLFTSLSFFLLKQSNLKLKLTGQILLHIVTVLSIVGLISYLLQIPSNDKTTFFETMAMHTSTLFFLLSIGVSLQNKNLGFYSFFEGNFAGHEIMRKVFPFLILTVLLLSFIIIWAIEKHTLSVTFAMELFTVVFITVISAYLAFISKSLNKIDQEKADFKNKLTINNQALSNFKNAFDQTNLVIITDTNGSITYYNHKFTSYLDNKTNFIGVKLEKLLFDITGKIFNIKYNDHIGKDNFWSGETPVITINQIDYWFYLTIIPLNTDKGKYEIYFIAQDITKMKKAELLMESNYVEKLKSKNKDLDDFAHIISHDLKAPLRGMNILVQLIQEKIGDKIPEANEPMDLLQERMQYLHNLIKDVLLYSRAGISSQSQENINLNDLINRIVRELSQGIDHVSFEIIGDFPVISGSTTLFYQIFSNIINNSIKFNDKEECIVKLECSNKGQHYEILISDNGPGIPESQLDRVFNIFQTANHKKNIDSSGIGLSIVRKLLHGIGGDIAIYNNQKEGITNKIKIPVKTCN